MADPRKGDLGSIPGRGRNVLFATRPTLHTVRRISEASQTGIKLSQHETIIQLSFDTAVGSVAFCCCCAPSAWSIHCKRRLRCKGRVPESSELAFLEIERDRLCGLVVRVSGYRSRGPGSIHVATRFSDK
jgi:hypothetical protein